MAEENKKAEPEKKDEAKDKKETKRDIPNNIESGMTVRIYQKIKEKKIGRAHV